MHTCPVCGCECDCQGDIEDHHNESLSATCECPCVECADDMDTLRHTLDDDDRGGLDREGCMSGLLFTNDDEPEM
jgi:hypothetical protein